MQPHEHKTLPMLIKELTAIEEPDLGLAPGIDAWSARNIFKMRVAEAVSDWVEYEARVAMEASRATRRPGLSVSQEADCHRRDVLDVINSALGSIYEDAIDAAAYLERHPDAYTAIAAE